MNISIRIIIFIVIVIFNIIPASFAQFQNSYQWQSVQSPLKINFNKIFLDDKGNGYLVGENLLSIEKDKISIFNPQPPGLSLSVFYALSKKEVWIARSNFFNTSNLYFYNGNGWEELYNPLANQITSIFFISRNEGWLGGDRELAYFNNGKWEIINIPHFQTIASSIIGLSKKELLLFSASTNELFLLKNNEWSLIKKDVNHLHYEKNKGIFFLSEGVIYKYSNYKYSRICSIPKNSIINSLHINFKDEIWASSENGKLYFYTNAKWKEIKLSTSRNLNAVNISSDNKGWIAGDNGTIFNLAKVPAEIVKKTEGGFNKTKIIPLSTELNKEYGIGIEDINNDGYKDVYANCFFVPNRLYINTYSTNKSINTNFDEEATERNINGIINKNRKQSSSIFNGIGIADIDNDGDQDLYLCDLIEKNDILLNNGNGEFKNVSSENNRGSGFMDRTNSIAYNDVDNDGDLDFFLANENSTNRLYENNGYGFFKDITYEAGLFSEGGGMSAVFGDIDNDNKSDLCVVNWGNRNLLYKNVSVKGKIKFINISQESGIQDFLADKSNGVLFIDYDNDAAPDIFITKRKSSNKLLRNNGNRKFTDVTEEVFGSKDSMLSYGVTASDFDNDGYVDLYINNVGGSVYYQNIDGKKYVDRTNEFNALVGGYGTGCASGDLDNDGDIDIYAGNYLGGESQLLINNINNNKFIKINVSGTLSNRDAVGVKVYLYIGNDIKDKNSLKGFKEITSGDGYCSHSAREVHFGINNPDTTYTAVIFFPSTKIERIIKNIKPGRVLFISEEDKFAASLTLLKKSFYRNINDKGNQKVLLISIVVLLLNYVSFIYGKKTYKWKFNKVITSYILGLILYAAQLIIYFEYNFWFSLVLSIAIVLTYLLIIHLYYERIILKKLAQQEKEKIRNRIARDLHDELASTLSSAQIYTEILKKNSKEKVEILNKISTLLKDGAESITDIIWNVSPLNDNLTDLVIKIKILLSETAKYNKISYEIKNNLLNNNFTLPDNVRRNIYLIFKECINNLQKYSDTKKVTLTIEHIDKKLIIILQDYGKGITNRIISAKKYEDLLLNNTELEGNGLRNIFLRADEINGMIELNSTPDIGTKIIFTLKMTH